MDCLKCVYIKINWVIIYTSSACFKDAYYTEKKLKNVSLFPKTF